jgi:hypothetical protein
MEIFQNYIELFQPLNYTIESKKKLQSITRESDANGGMNLFSSKRRGVINRAPVNQVI